MKFYIFKIKMHYLECRLRGGWEGRRAVPPLHQI